MSDHTSRSRFLSRALEYFETGDALALFDLANDFWIETSMADIEELSDEDNAVLNRMLAELRESQAQVLVTSRITLDKRVQADPKGIVLRYLDQMSVPGRQVVQGVLLSALQRLQNDGTSSTSDNGFDVLDMRYSQELVRMLPNVVAKAAALQDIEVGSIPHQSVKRYFREAHSCYFFGLNRACAVMCRAILESSLKGVLGAQNSWHDLIELTERPRQNGRPLLDAERIEAAEKVYRAGNLAVHDEERFEARYPDVAVEALLIDMRKILEDIYSASVAGT
jgi:hypothetical protein